MTDIGQSSKVYTVADPVGSAVDIRSVKSGAFIAPSKARDDTNAIVGMPLRHILIEGDVGVVLSATMTLPDVAFIARSLAELLDDDLAIWTELGNFKMLGRQGNLDKLKDDIEATRAKMDAALQRLTRLAVYAPPSPEKGEGELDEGGE